MAYFHSSPLLATLEHPGEGKQRLTIRKTRFGWIKRTSTLTESAFLGLCVSSDDKFLAVYCSKYIQVWNAEKISSPVCRLENVAKLHFTGIAFHPSGQYLAATSNDTTVKLYDTATWQLAKTFTWNIGRLRSIAFSPDGMLAAVGSDTGRIMVWDVDL